MQIAFLDDYKNVNAHVLNPVFLVVSTCKISGICWFTHGRRDPNSDVGVDDSKHRGFNPVHATAVDLQIWDGRHVNEQGMTRLKGLLQRRLPDGYDIVLEEPGEYDNEHLLLHVEHDRDIGSTSIGGA
jgi:hypothetical protein